MATKKKAPRRKRRGLSRRYVKEFMDASDRARKLYERIVERGYAVKEDGQDPKPLSNPDRRDITEYIFFEVAAKFEQFAKRTLVLEVQKTFHVSRTRAEHMIGSSDDGIRSTMGGWAHTSKMKKRAAGLLGKNSVYARIESHLGNPRVRYLQMAVIIRNRIAHGKGSRAFIDMLRNAPVRLNAQQRQGVSPGRFLSEYPKNAKKDDKWFFRILDAYEAWAEIVKRKI